LPDPICGKNRLGQELRRQTKRQKKKALVNKKQKEQEPKAIADFNSTQSA